MINILTSKRASHDVIDVGHELSGLYMTVRVFVTRGLTAMAGRWLTELQGVTVDFWGGPAPASPMASGGPAPLARMYREQLCRRARSVGTVGLLPELNGCSFETEEYLLRRSRVAVVCFLPSSRSLVVVVS